MDGWMDGCMHMFMNHLRYPIYIIYIYISYSCDSVCPNILLTHCFNLTYLDLRKGMAQISSSNPEILMGITVYTNMIFCESCPTNCAHKMLEMHRCILPGRMFETSSSTVVEQNRHSLKHLMLCGCWEGSMFGCVSQWQHPITSSARRAASNTCLATGQRSPAISVSPSIIETDLHLSIILSSGNQT